jgi:hypothetical protein
MEMMQLKEPQSMDECGYMTNRFIGDKGKLRCWVFKQQCSECHKGMMGKPKDSKTGKPRIRAKEYVCDSCGRVAEKVEYEAGLTANIAYTCPKCEKDGEHQMPFKRRKMKMFDEAKGKDVTVEALKFECDCGEKILVTKKMK